MKGTTINKTGQITNIRVIKVFKKEITLMANKITTILILIKIMVFPKIGIIEITKIRKATNGIIKIIKGMEVK